MILGWFLLFFTLGVGLIAVPFDLFYDYIKRPKPMKSAEFEVQKKFLLDNLLFLRLRCNESFDVKTKVDTQKGFKAWWNSARLTRRVASIHSKTLILEDEYIKLVKVSKYSKYVEPMSYYFKIALGVILSIVNILIVIQLVGCQLLKSDDDGEWKFKFLNTIIDALSKKETGLGFITTGIIFLLSVYLLYCAHYGNTKLGLRFVIYYKFYCIFSINKKIALFIIKN